MIKFEHTIFALPFAYLGMVLGAKGLPPFFIFLWITFAMVGARSYAMALNRLYGKIDPGDTKRIASALGTFEASVDTQELREKLIIPCA